ncbi:hypothetical protein L288_02290 [Sphingobium quisquiliarum P25]|uniref:Alpha/beta hydrolase fold-3 domain-containing protein n=1 Tax=Sphingobium quisquiliarum P25 TaxID=1329909 RepID=T0HLE2_9SPHN|nr:alpha/beta hydrolase [Sphingobium quisquiliarum]EQB13807.1 hypothetical protein L288_02290 [Sphingobium quisquiliarum P25]
MTNLFDPALEALIAEQQAFNASVPDDIPANIPPAPPATELPAEARDISGVPVRIIRPADAAAGIYLHFHGGGFVEGSAAMADYPNRHIAKTIGAVTVSVDYRLAPAHPFPAARDDCFTVARWLLDHGAAEFGADRIVIGGDSVGATLAVMVLLQLRDASGAAKRVAGASLVAGNYDLSGTPSQRRTTPGKFLSPKRLGQTRECAFPGRTGEALRDPAISTLYADLADMPPALFTVGTQDVVLDDSMFMAARWRAAGNSAELAIYPEGRHLLLAQPTKMARAARSRIHHFIAERLKA